jgi:hypothetical protein
VGRKIAGTWVAGRNRSGVFLRVFSVQGVRGGRFAAPRTIRR